MINQNNQLKSLAFSIAHESRNSLGGISQICDLMKDNISQLNEFFDLIKTIPAVIVGSWLGIKIYNQINEGLFRKTVLALILISGLFLLF